MKKFYICDDEKYKKYSKLAEENNYGMEVQSFHSPYSYDETELIDDNKKEISRIKGENLSFHAIFGDLCPGSGDWLVRDVANKRFNQSYNLAKDLGVSALIFHIGYVPGCGPVSNWSKRCINFWNEFLRDKPETMTFYIENVLEHDAEMLDRVISGINKPNVKVNLDIGHAHCYSKVSVLEWINTLKSKIGYVHLHDNNGKNDEHLGLGMGNIPMKEVLEALNTYAPDAIWALECQSEYMESSIDWLKKYKYI